MCATSFWWVNTSETWLYHEILQWFVDACWDVNLAAVAAGLLVHHFSNTHRDDFSARCGGISSASLMFLLDISFPKNRPARATPPTAAAKPRETQPAPPNIRNPTQKESPDHPMYQESCPRHA